MSFVHVFPALLFPSFPSPPQHFTVYAALYGGEGEVRMELVISRLEPEKDRILHKKGVAFPGRGEVILL
jgi:hypothetical protein